MYASKEIREFKGNPGKSEEIAGSQGKSRTIRENQKKT